MASLLHPPHGGARTRHNRQKVLIPMGTSSQQATAFVLADADTWIEGSAIQQLEHTARLPGMIQVAGMPDLHPGRGYPVGAAFFSQGFFYPADKVIVEIMPTLH